jgi:pyruvate,water dikinase
MNYVIPLNKLQLKDAHRVGGKNAALGELMKEFSSKGISVPVGIALSIDAFDDFLKGNNLNENIDKLLSLSATKNTAALYRVSSILKRKFVHTSLSEQLRSEIQTNLGILRDTSKANAQFSVRSSATFEDDPKTSFAGLHDSFLNLRDDEDIFRAVIRCYASLYNQRAIFYRNQHNIPHNMVKMAVVIQVMVEADKVPGCSGVCFSIDPDSGFQNVIVVQSNWGLGESVVKGLVDPDEFTVFKPFLYSVSHPIISKT